MKFSLKLAIVNLVSEWMDSKRKEIQHAITERQIKNMTNGITVIENNGSFSIQNLNSGNIQELAGILKMAEEIGHGSVFTRMLTWRMDKKLFGPNEGVRS